MDSLVTRFLCLYGMINSPLRMLIMVFSIHKNVLYNSSLPFLVVVRRFGQVVRRLCTLCPDASDKLSGGLGHFVRRLRTGRVEPSVDCNLW